MFYVPLEFGGSSDLDNIVCVCSAHINLTSPAKPVRQPLPDLNTFADLVELLIQSLIQAKEFKDQKNTDYFPLKEKIQRIKRLLNAEMETIAMSFRYKPFLDFDPENHEYIVEGSNSLADLVTLGTLANIDGDSESSEKVKEKLKNQLHNAVATKTYKIMGQDDE